MCSLLLCDSYICSSGLDALVYMKCDAFNSTSQHLCSALDNPFVGRS